jgi:TPP-dependent pyruvate/acetoin dehydrogenase alpha subunit
VGNMSNNYDFWFKLYEKMLAIRMLEDELQKLCYEGEAGDLHFSKGQEAISVGVCAALKDTDYMVTHHRTIAHSIAKGVPLEPLVAEVLGKETGVSRGYAGEMHLHYPEKRYMFSFQLVGTCIPVAAGLAWAVKYHQKTNDIVSVFFGDAASSNAQFHEGTTIASLRKVPLLMICENNHRAGNISPQYYLPTDTVSDKMASYGIQAKKIDGNNIFEVYREAQHAIAHVRNYKEPYLLEMDTTRLCWHKQGQRDIRTPEEIETEAKRDPIDFIARQLNIPNMYHNDIATKIEMAIEKARATPYPQMSLSA